MRFRDESRTAIILASGESALGAIRSGETAKHFPILCVSDGYRICPAGGGEPGWRYLYAADQRWWDGHAETIRRIFQGEGWTQDKVAAERYGLKHIRVVSEPGLSLEPTHVKAGGFIGNSGAQAINLAVLWGAKRLVLVGFDMDGGHFFGEHPKGIHRDTDFRTFVRGMCDLALGLARARVTVLNASPKSKLPYWPRMTLPQALQQCEPLEPSALSAMSPCIDETAFMRD